MAIPRYKTIKSTNLDVSSQKFGSILPTIKNKLANELSIRFKIPLNDVWNFPLDSTAIHYTFREKNCGLIIGYGKLAKRGTLTEYDSISKLFVIEGMEGYMPCLLNVLLRGVDAYFGNPHYVNLLLTEKFLQVLELNTGIYLVGKRFETETLVTKNNYIYEEEFS